MFHFITVFLKTKIVILNLRNRHHKGLTDWKCIVLIINTIITLAYVIQNMIVGNRTHNYHYISATGILYDLINVYEMSIQFLENTQFLGYFGMYACRFIAYYYENKLFRNNFVVINHFLLNIHRLVLYQCMLKGFLV